MKRNYGIDLLRLILMYMVVVLHVLGEGGIIRNAELFSKHYYLSWSLEVLCYCAVNCFALITGYVHYKAKYKLSSLIHLILQAVFYTVLLEVLNWMLVPGSFSLKSLVNALFPAYREAWWYVSSYVGLFIIIPVLECAVSNFTERQAFSFLILSFAAYSVLPTFLMSDPFKLTYGYSTLWLAYLYLIGAFIRKFDWGRNIRIRRMLQVFSGCVILTFGSKFLMDTITYHLFGVTKFSAILIDYTSPTILMASIALFAASSKLQLNRKMTNAVKSFSHAAFGVYLIHCHPHVFGLFTDRFMFVLDLPAIFLPVIVLASAAVIFVVCLLLDCLRSVLFKRMQITDRLQWIDRKLMSAFSEMG